MIERRVLNGLQLRAIGNVERLQAGAVGEGGRVYARYAGRNGNQQQATAVLKSIAADCRQL